MRQDNPILFPLVTIATVALALAVVWYDHNSKKEQDLAPGREIEVNCEAPEGWVTYKSTILKARNGRGGWYIETLDGSYIRASNCITQYPEEWR